MNPTRPMRRLLAPVLAVALLAACSTPGDDAAHAAVPETPAAAPRDTALLSARAVEMGGFVVVPAAARPWREAWTVPARLALDPSETHRLGSIAEGRVVAVHARVGDRVRAGQVLVRLHSHEMLDARGALATAEADVARAESAARLAASEAERGERLYAIKALSLADLERARAGRVDADASRRRARAELERARAMVGHLVGTGPVPAGTDEHEVLVRAPADGIVVSREAEPGQVVLVGAPLLTVSRLASPMLVLHLPEAAAPAARPGAEVAFTVSGMPGRTFAARVARVAPALDTLTRTVEVQAAVTADAALLRPEMFATARLLGHASGETLSVPAEAVQAFDDDTVVITAARVGAAMRIEAVRVRTGRRAGEMVEVVSGLAPGTPVVTTGASIARAEILRRRDGAGGE
jgi:membrane fusion protein, heavy metal efflux system